MKNGIKIILVIMLLVATALSIYNFLSAKNLAYVNTANVYNKFEMKIELEKKLETTKNARELVLDSLLTDVETLVHYIENNREDQEAVTKYGQLREEYLVKEKQFQDDNAVLAQKYTDQIWEQLNQYIKDFGKNNKYRYIYGTNGQGSLMYAAEGDNITEEVTNYVNEKYQGIK